MLVPREANTVIELFCALLCLVLLISLYLDRKSGDKTSRWFFFMVLSCIFMNLGGMTDWVFSGVPGTAPGLILWVGSAVFYISGATLMLAYTGYLVAFIEHKQWDVPRKFINLTRVLAGITAASAATSPLTHWVFYVTPGDNVYYRGTLFIPSQISTYCIYVLAAYILIRYRKTLDGRAKFFFWTFSLTPLGAQITQALVRGVALVTPMITLSLLLVFIFIQTERRLENELATQQAVLEHLEHQRKLQAELTGQTIVALSNAVEAKDHYTNGHSQRVAEYAREIARRLGWTEEQQLRVYYAGMLHDVGKIRVPDTIINKTGRLTDTEYEEVKLHTVAGYYMLKGISSISEFAAAARWHHERYDGQGYPSGLSGENIPLVARIIGVADAYDAMTSNRSYRTLIPQETVRREIERGAGVQFDPQIARIMLDMIDEDPEYEMRQVDVEMSWTVLAIDDDPTVLRRLDRILGEDPHYTVLAATSGQRGLEILRHRRVDLVLLDLHMPEMDGFEALARIREEFGPIPVIFMTGAKELELIQRAENMGINDYLTKPPVDRQLWASIHNVLSDAHEGQAAGML